MALTIGSSAPDFELINQHGEKISLSSFRGKKNVVVIFYPFACAVPVVVIDLPVIV